VKAKLGQQFVDYLISPEGQKVIASYKVSGQQLFHPDANKPGA
jgi:tungstate transport system substrate-binding protein